QHGIRRRRGRLPRLDPRRTHRDPDAPAARIPVGPGVRRLTMRTRTFTPGRALAWVIMAAIVVGTVFPFWWMIRTALTPAADLYTDNAGLLPGHPTLINFTRVLGLTSEAEARAAGGSG